MIDYLKQAQDVHKQAREMMAAARPLYQAAAEAEQDAIELEREMALALDTIEKYRAGIGNVTDDSFTQASDRVAILRVKLDRARAIHANKKREADRVGYSNAVEADQLKRHLRNQFDSYQREQLRAVIEAMDGKQPS